MLHTQLHCFCLTILGEAPLQSSKHTKLHTRVPPVLVLQMNGLGGSNLLAPHGRICCGPRRNLGPIQRMDFVVFFEHFMGFILVLNSLLELLCSSFRCLAFSCPLLRSSSVNGRQHHSPNAPHTPFSNITYSHKHKHIPHAHKQALGL